jgi:glycosyltransferase involved in cell wall biosynthesis
MKKHKVLMLGWGNIPAVHSGLGIACHGLCKSLSKLVDLTLIVPSSDRKDILHGINMIMTEGGEQPDTASTQDQKAHRSVVDPEYDVLDLPADLDPYYFTKQDATLVRELKTSKAKKVGDAGEQRSDQSIDYLLSDLERDDILERVMLYAKKVAEIAKGLEFDVIHAHDWMTFLAGIYVKNNSGKPLILHIHSLDYDRTGAGNKTWIFNIERYALSKADQVISVSHYTSGIIFSRYGLSSRKVITVHNGVEPMETFRSPSGHKEKTVLFVGRITGQKGPKYFLQIALKVLQKYKNARFIMVGAGDELQEIVDSGAFRKLNNRIEVKGFLEQEALKKIYALSDVFCLPSVSEPFGLAALEAAQFGIPVVLSSRSGVSEVLKSAFRADYWDIDLMAQHIVSLLSDEKLHTKKAEQGLADIKKATWKNAAKKILQVYDRLLEPK